MQYAGNSDSQDIVTLANLITKADNNSFPLTDKATYANMAMRTIWSHIFQA